MRTEEYFRDKTCVVTGAASGIGLALSEALLQAGTNTGPGRPGPDRTGNIGGLAAFFLASPPLAP